MSFDHEII